MELGNLVMGHASIDNYSIDRGKYQEVFSAVLKYMGFSNYGNFEETEISDDFDKEVRSRIDKHGKYENETFSIFPYWWGDCECDYEKWSEEWDKKHTHQSTCYCEELKVMEERKGEASRKITDKGINTMDLSGLTLEEARPLLKKHGLPEQGWGVHCDCNYQMNWNSALMERGETHTKECPMSFPNFVYKPTDLRIEWYKYPFRDSYSNRKFTAEEFLEMMTNCVEAFYK